jgi:hypothetical protein
VVYVCSATLTSMKWIDQLCTFPVFRIVFSSTHTLTPMVSPCRISSLTMMTMTGTRKRKHVSFHLMFNSYECYLLFLPNQCCICFQTWLKKVLFGLQKKTTMSNDCWTLKRFSFVGILLRLQLIEQFRWE